MVGCTSGSMSQSKDELGLGVTVLETILPPLCL